MKFLFINLLLIPIFIVSQEKSFDLEIHYGPQYFYWAKYEQDPSEVPAGYLSWFNKDRIGTVFGTELNWNLKKGKSKSTIGLFYERQMNVGKHTDRFYAGSTPVIIKDFKLRDINNYFGIQYKFKLNDKFKLIFGFYQVNESRQEIDYFGSLNIKERNAKNSGLQDGGICFGAEYYFYNSGRFSFGIKSKLFWTLSLGSVDMINITPSLKYNF